jgi:outer membrane receptor for ferric coprogen and ferric-rhodotorulic acid
MSPHKLLANLRLLAWLTALGAVSASAQPAPAPDNAPVAPVVVDQSAPPADIVQMNKFEVSSTQGKGYSVPNSVGGFKTDEKLLDIPQVDLVMTRDLLNDIGYDTTSEVLQFLGISATTTGESARIRGGAALTPYIDELPDGLPFADAAWYDSYQVIKGPVQVLYLNAALSGLVIKTAKKALPYNQEIVTLGVNSWGRIHATVDLTGPLFDVGGTKIDYRFVDSYWHGHEYFDNLYERRNTAMLGTKIYWRDSVITAYVTNWEMLLPTDGYEFITPTGQIFTGAGRESSGAPPNDMVWWWGYHGYFQLLTKLGQNWESRLKAGGYMMRRYSKEGESFNTQVDWDKGLLSLQSRQDNYNQQYFSMVEDIQGNYDFGTPFKQIDSFGWGLYDYSLKTRLWSAANVPAWTSQADYSATTGGGVGGVVIPMNSLHAINSVSMPSWQQYDANPPANEGLHAEQLVWNFYWQHTIDLIPNWLSVVGGWSYAGITLWSVANVSTEPWTAIQTPAQSWVHRLGTVFHATKDVSLYAMVATAFSPPGAGNVLENGLLPPVIVGKAQEVGMKSSLFQDRLSLDFAWFKMTTTNTEVAGGTLPSGLTFYNLLAFNVQEGVDGDVAMTLFPGWQLIGTFYAGHNRDQLGRPVGNSYDNSWSVFTRYSFPRDSSFHRFAFGTGFVRIGGRWDPDVNLKDAPLTPFNTWSGEIKMYTGSVWDAFATYAVTRHLMLRLNCDNILDSRYVEASSTAMGADPSVPTTFYLEADYKF